MGAVKFGYALACALGRVSSKNKCAKLFVIEF
jgi:hypothetical protein